MAARSRGLGPRRGGRAGAARGPGPARAAEINVPERISKVRGRARPTPPSFPPPAPHPSSPPPQPGGST